MIKAYEVFDREHYADYSIIVFAESRGKAVSYAIGTDEFPKYEWDFTQLTAKRMSAFDKCYNGRWRMDWDNDEDRRSMVEYGYYCSDDVFDPDMWCETCSAKDICARYQEYLEEEAEYDEQGDT